MPKTQTALPTFASAVVAWMSARETCEHYHGFKEDDDSVQCSHPDQRDPGAWCSVTRCPRLREAGEQHGVV